MLREGAALGLKLSEPSPAVSRRNMRTTAKDQGVPWRSQPLLQDLLNKTLVYSLPSCAVTLLSQFSSYVFFF